MITVFTLSHFKLKFYSEVMMFFICELHSMFYTEPKQYQIINTTPSQPAVQLSIFQVVPVFSREPNNNAKQKNTAAPLRAKRAKRKAGARSKKILRQRGGERKHNTSKIRATAIRTFPHTSLNVLKDKIP